MSVLLSLLRISKSALETNFQKSFPGVQRVMISQTVGGLVFSFLGGQPMIVLLSTAPLALYIKGEEDGEKKARDLKSINIRYVSYPHFCNFLSYTAF